MLTSGISLIIILFIMNNSKKHTAPNKVMRHFWFFEISMFIYSRYDHFKLSAFQSILMKFGHMLNPGQRTTLHYGNRLAAMDLKVLAMLLHQAVDLNKVSSIVLEMNTWRKGHPVIGEKYGQDMEELMLLTMSQYSKRIHQATACRILEDLERLQAIMINQIVPIFWNTVQYG